MKDFFLGTTSNITSAHFHHTFEVLHVLQGDTTRQFPSASMLLRRVPPRSVQTQKPCRRAKLNSCCTCRVRSHKYSESVFWEGSGSHSTWGLSVVSSVPCTGGAMRRLRRPHVAALGVGMAARVGAFVAPTRSGHILILSETRSEASAPARTCQRSRRRHLSMSQVMSSWSGKEQEEGSDDQKSFWDTAVEVSVTCNVCAPGCDTLMAVRFTTFNSRFGIMYTKSRNCHRYNTKYLHILKVVS